MNTRIPIVALVTFTLTALASGSDRLTNLEARLAAQQARLQQLDAALTTAEAAPVRQLRDAALRDQIRSILSEAEFREALAPTLISAAYDNGFYIRSADDTFRLQINAYTQIRWTHYASQRTNNYLLPGFQRDDITGFDLQRLVIEFSGNAYEPALTYALGIAMDAVDNNAAGLDHAEISYAFNDAFAITAGFFGASSTRSNAIDPRNLAFVSRSMFDAVFGLGDGMGVRFSGALANSRFEYALDVINATADGEESAVDSVINTDQAPLDSNPALATRLVWHAVGDDPSIFESESDIARTESPALDLGLHYVFNPNDNDNTTTTRIPVPIRDNNRVGPLALVPSTGLHMHQFGVDSAFRYRGFALNSEYALRVLNVRDRLAPFARASSQRDTTVQHGGYVQVGYFLPIPNMPDRVELIGRISMVSALANRQVTSWEYAAGANYYIHGENVKLQADIARIDNAPISANYHSLANVNDDILLFRMQLQVAF